MTETKRCPQCGAEMPEGIAGQPCPACLMRLGLASWHSGGGAVAATQGDAAAARLGEFQVPSIEELSLQIPELEILELIGQGGMGAVYKARQKSLGRIVALKVLKPDLAAVPEFAERFSREAKSLAQLNHRNIVTVHDFGQRDGLCYLVMEYVEGANLRRVLEAGQLSPQEALRLVPDLCDALEYAHNAGVVHRDIKPENILLDEVGRVKIADFGLAKLVGQPDVRLTATNQVMGTLRYMAPEQMEGTSSVDHRADIYSLGVIIYEMLTGELPVGRFAPPSAKVGIDVRLDEVVLRALEREPQRRYQHASQVKTDIEAISGSPPRVAPVKYGGERPRFSRKAIVGAAWAPFFFIFVLGALMTVTVESHPAMVVHRSTGFMEADGTLHGDSQVETGHLQGKSWAGIGLKMLFLVMLPLGLAAPFGTTILGFIAISDIRHSGERVYGLPLAVADALFFPLLVLDAVLVWIGLLFVALFARVFSFGVGPAEIVVLAIPLVLVIDALIVWAVWQKASHPIAASK